MTDEIESCGEEGCIWCAGRELAEDFVDHATMALAHNGASETAIALLYAFLVSHVSMMPEGTSNEAFGALAHEALSHALSTLPVDLRK
jgi:hypothetical protein